MAPPVHGHDNLVSRIEAVRAHLREHLTETVTLAEMAHLAGLSRFRLAKVFRSLVGVPPHAYLIQLRIEHAKHMLAAGRPISALAQETGFFDLSHFTKHFKRHVGISPGVFIKRSLADQGDSEAGPGIDRIGA